MIAAQLAVAAAPRGLIPIGFPGSIANFRDFDLYVRQIGRGRDLGMRAVAAIHPPQLPVIRAALAPTEAELKWADEVLARLQAGGAIFALEGQMVDAPVAARASDPCGTAAARQKDGSRWLTPACRAQAADCTHIGQSGRRASPAW